MNIKPEIKKKADVDLWIIFISTILVIILYNSFSSVIINIIKNKSMYILLRLSLVASLQFGTAGLGITIISLLRKENFSMHGLNRHNIIQSIVLCSLCFIPNIMYTYYHEGTITYFPFRKVWLTGELLTKELPVTVIGMLITSLIWGFFEGFNYVVISDKINERYPCKNRWANWGALSCGVLCILIHGVIGVTVDTILETISIFIIIYGMLMVKNITGNAWGCVFIFIIFWNAY